MPVRKIRFASYCWIECPIAELLVTREGSYVMDQVLCELVELTESELDVVAGGNPFSINISALFSDVDARVRASLENESSNTLNNLVDNSIHVSGP